MEKTVNKLFKLSQTASLRVLGAVSQLLLYFFASHLYSPKEIAPLFFAINLSSFATPILLRGYHSYAVKEIASLDDDYKKEALMGGVIFDHVKVLFPISLLSMIILYGICLFFKISLLYLFIVVPIFFIIPIFSQLGYYFQAFKKYNIAIIILNILYPALILLLMFAIKALSINIPIISLTIPASIITLILSYFLYKNLIISKNISHDEHVKYSFSAETKIKINHYWLAYVLTYIGIWAPIILFYGFGDKVQYSYYSASDRIANTVNFFLIISSFIVSPVIAELHIKDNKYKLEGLVINATRLTSVLALPVVIILFFFTRDILYFFNKDYVDAAAYLQILTIAQFYNIVTGCVNPMLLMTGHLKELIKSNIAALLVEFLALIILPYYVGNVGFAIAFASYSFIQNSTAVYYVYRTLNINVLNIFAFNRFRITNNG